MKFLQAPELSRVHVVRAWIVRIVEVKLINFNEICTNSITQDNKTFDFCQIAWSLVVMVIILIFMGN